MTSIGKIGCLLLALVFLAGPTPSGAQAGLAKNYTGDGGIAIDGDVILAEAFDGSLAEIVGRWTNSQNTAGMSLTTDVPSGSGGSRSLLMTSSGGANTGGQLYKKLTPGYE